MTGQNGTRNRVTDAEYAQAVAAGAREAQEQFRASSVRHLADCDAVEILTMRDGGFVVPRRLIGALEDATATELAELEVWPGGSVIELSSKDVQIAVHGLIAAVLPVLLSRPEVAGMFAALGISVRSKAKAKTAQGEWQEGTDARECERHDRARRGA